MKKLLALLLALVMVLSFAACNNQPTESESESQVESESQSEVEEPFVAVHAERDDSHEQNDYSTAFAKLQVLNCKVF